MKKHSIISAFLATVLFVLAGCGKEEQRQQEVVREFERTFAIEPAPVQPSAQPSTSPGSYSAPATGGGTTGTTRTSGGSTAPVASSAATGPSGEEVSPVVREAAQQVVQYINTRQYASAVQRLDSLMSEPTLTADQWMASRNAMAELQGRIARDSSITDEERNQVRRVLERRR